MSYLRRLNIDFRLDDFFFWISIDQFWFLTMSCETQDVLESMCNVNECEFILDNLEALIRISHNVRGRLFLVGLSFRCEDGETIVENKTNRKIRISLQIFESV